VDGPAKREFGYSLVFPTKLLDTLLMNKELMQFVNGLLEDTNYKSRAEMLEMVNAIYIKCIEMGKSITNGDYDYMIDLD
jgi:hypothetical protein